MELRELGKSGIRVSPVIMGMWQAGREMWAGIDDAEIRRALRQAVESGINAFDTAEMYGQGHSERVLGAALGDVRSQVVYLTKVAPDHLRYDQVVAACERSLKHLATEVIDLYQIHWPSGAWGSPRVPMEETMRALNDLKAQGKIRAIGVSNFTAAQIEEAARFGTIDTLQPPYSLFWRALERDELPYCSAHGMTVLAYSPLAQGILAGRFPAEPEFDPGDHRKRHRLFRPDIYPHVHRAVERLRSIAARNGLTPAQLALAWVIARPNVCAIAGARHAQQVADNARAAQVQLSPGDLAEMDAIGRTVTDRLDDDPVQWNF